MPSTFFGLNIGKSALYATNAAINTTAHNISNAETEGYCRQIVKQQASSALRVNATYGMAGTGVDVVGVENVRDQYYDSKYRSNSLIFGEYSTKSYYMGTLENYFNEVKLEGFNVNFDKMFDGFQELSKNPSDGTVRTAVVNYAQSMSEYFNSMHENMQRIQEECNFEIRNQVDRINSIGQQVATLTKQINTMEVTGGKANDLRDRRELLIDELSAMANVSVKEKVVGDGVGITSYVVYLDGQPLVDTYSSNSLKVVPRKDKVNQEDIDGLYDICWSGGQDFNVQSETLKGNLKALFEFRDGNNSEGFNGKVTGSAGDTTITVTNTSCNNVDTLTIPDRGLLRIGSREYAYDGFQVSVDEDTGEYIYEFSLEEEMRADADDQDISIGEQIDYKGIPYYMSQMNEFVRTFGKAFNDIHKSGQDLKGNLGLDFFNGKQAATGENYVFETSQEDIDNGVLFSTKTGIYATEDEDKNYGSYYFMTAGNLCVTNAIFSNPDLVAAAGSIIDGIEDAEYINKLIALKTDVSMFKQGKPASFLQTLVAEIGIDTDKSSQLSDNQEDILSAVTNQRLSVSGVDSDEEAMNLVHYQQTFNLAAKIIATMDEIYDKLINYMGA